MNEDMVEVIFVGLYGGIYIHKIIPWIPNMEKMYFSKHFDDRVIVYHMLLNHHFSVDNPTIEDVLAPAFRYKVDTNGIQGEFFAYDIYGFVIYHTWYHNGLDLKVNPDLLTDADKMYIVLSNRLPERFHDKPQDSDS